MLFHRLTLVCLAALLSAALMDVSSAHAQLLRRRPLAAAEPTADAVVGRPFGVGSISFQMPPEARNGLFNEQGFTLVEKNGRALYATFDARPVRAILREVLNRPQTVTAYFLFTGEEPLELELFAPTGVRRTITPRRDPGAHQQLLQSWWDKYADSTRGANKNDEYPVLVDNYLTSMLSRRLSLPTVKPEPSIFGREDVEQALGVLVGTEKARTKMLEQLMLTGRLEALSEPLPQQLPPPELVFPKLADDIKIEAIARHVPQECFYVRFGGFANYRWFRGVIDEFGGDLRNLVTARGLGYSINDRVQQQLILRENALAALLGPQVIADVALIGHDPFLREGAGMGMLFQARNNFALSSDFNSQRAAALAANKDARESTVEIADRKVSFIATPDNRIRSFYAVDGDFHLVTTSRNLVRRFYEAGAGTGSLGESGEFRFARSRMPLDREDTVFAYLSSSFFHELASPRYRVEMYRRLRSTTEIAMFKLAQLAAKNEGRDTSFAEMTADGFVPESLGQRPDGSKLLFVENGAIADSLRGAQGSFTPIADVSFDRITNMELQDYRQFENLYAGQLQQLDPIFVAVKRYAGSQQDSERIVLDVSVSPIAQKHFAMLTDVLGPPTTQRMAPIPGNLISLEAHSKYQSVDPTHLFFGLQNIPTAFAGGDGLLSMLATFQNLKIYFGGWPSVGPLRAFGLRDDLPTNADGFARASASLYQRYSGPFITGSGDIDLLANVTSQMRVVEARRPGQLWLNVGDIGNSDLRKLVNTYGYFRARQITGGNLHLLHTLSSQLGVPADQSMNIAEDLLEAQLQCALNGELKLSQRAGEPATWFSTAWTRDTGRLLTSAPQDFVTPPLDWFRGLDLDLWMEPRELSLHSQIEMQRRPQPAGTPAVAEPILPAFPFKGFNFFGGGADSGKGDESGKGPVIDKNKDTVKDAAPQSDSSVTGPKLNVPTSNEPTPSVKVPTPSVKVPPRPVPDNNP